MREFILEIFNEHQANDFNGISIFSWAHILYLLMIFLTIAVITIVFRKKSSETKEKIISIFAILVAVSYFSDFFFQPFYNDGTMADNGELILDKLPFHICTALCPLILISRFSKLADKIKTPIVVVSIAAALMWLVYPGSALDTDVVFYDYEIMQLFFYHGLVFAYGCLSLLLNETKLDIKKSYKDAICIVGIALWATLGNLLYSSENHDYNWFFLKDPVFSFVPTSINPITVVLSVYLVCLVVYGVYYLTKHLYNLKK